MQIYFEKGKHNAHCYEYFNFDELDAFHSEDVLRTIYGDDWNSVLVIDDGKAFLHSFSKSRIEDSEFFDIEPFLGYSGPVTNTSDTGFIKKAYLKYGEICKGQNIIAEIVRFNPLLQNHTKFQDIINIVIAKKIIIIECNQTDSDLLKDFSPTCRQKIAKGMKSLLFDKLDKKLEWEKFVELYYKSLKRVNADNKWYMNKCFYESVKSSNLFDVYAVKNQNNEMYSITLILKNKFAGYYLLTANSDSLITGANEFLIYGSAKEIELQKIPYFILGGGNSASDEDSLYTFKKKFSKKTYDFYIGKIIHIESIYHDFCNEVIQRKPELEASSHFLKYRLAL